ncbi:MAG: tetratricopeptide repeat protein [Verrucomicrobiae bacterium]|nr:tetratricopeptide repeat protein [Verrucomicrobiae bacterium]
MELEAQKEFERSLVLIDQKRYADAEKYLRFALEKDFNNSKIYHNLAYCLLQQPEKTAEAFAAIVKALELEPNDFESHALAALILVARYRSLHFKTDFHSIRLKIRMSNEAKKEAQIAIQLNPQSSFAFFALASVCFATSHWTKAEEAARQALFLNADSLGAAIRLIWALRKQKKYSEARILLEHWLSRYPNDASLLEEKGRLNLCDEKFSEAKHSFLDALRFNPQSISAKIGLKHSFLVRFFLFQLLFKWHNWFWSLTFWPRLIMGIGILIFIYVLGGLIIGIIFGKFFNGTL